MRKILASLAALTLGAFPFAPAHAQSYPNPSKPIRIIVPTSPAGGNDAMARIIAQKLNERMKQPVIVENKAGANGAIGSEFVAKAAPDGYTILFGYIATHGINPALSKVPYDPVKDFAPIAEVAEAQGVLVVTPSVPAKSVKELIALAKAKPGQLSYASAGNGTAPHISGELFKQMTGTDLLHVPYKGSGPAVTDTLAGTTQVMFPSLVAASGHIKSGKLRGLAVTGKKRSPLFPDLPTIAESGVAGFEVVQWYGLFAPAKTPKDIVDRLNREVVAVMKDPETVKKFAAQGADVVAGSPDELGKLVQSELAKWGKFIKEARITAD
ncbi:MAG TPA: tripartite tricarboxylate transporter substrate binding protein [Burkholderiales bacterium]|nr:tripartite tricarboxylate transporter substrate binding protein [Burkholderiales bacterium]